MNYKIRIRNLCLASILCLALGFAGCATDTPLPSNATTQQKAQRALSSAEKAIPFVVGPAVTAWLLLQRDVAKQQQDAAYVYAAATAINSAATGQQMTPAQLQALIATFTAPDPRYASLAQLLTSEYAQLYPLFGIAGSNPVKFFTAVALAAQTAAQPFLALKTASLTSEQARIVVVAVALYEATYEYLAVVRKQSSRG
jgi:hypothetical protein